MSVPKRTGIANLPLHHGKAPRWLFDRMVPLAREITIAIVTDFGPEEMLRRLSHPTGSRPWAVSWALTGTQAGSLLHCVVPSRKE